MNGTLKISTQMFMNLKTGVMCFGFIASDHYDNTHVDNSWNSLEAFLNDFPNETLLQMHVLELEEFNDSADEYEFIVVEFPPTA